ncbi:MAG: TonB-dependent receptor [Caulobacteraceae bacterium]|nr:TonB-dependent receptor [Caulobacteraceae bacterium]
MRTGEGVLRMALSRAYRLKDAWPPAAGVALLAAGALAAPAFAADAPAASAALPVLAAATADLDAASVDSVVVTAQRNRVPDLKDVAGNTTVITSDHIERGRVSTVADALRYEPGLLAQSATGTEATRFSMRGSGVIRGASSWGTGIQMLFDGLPLTTPEGSPYEYYEPLANNYIEVYRGANAFDYGPTTQGGAINYVPHTGQDSSPLLARVEAGSFGYQRQQLASGQVLGPIDYYVTYTHFGTDGFRRGNSSYSQRVLGDVGYRFSDQLKTRFYFEYAAQNTRNASSLTLAQIAADPTTNTTTSGNRREKGSTLVGDRTVYQIDNTSSLEGGFLYKNYPLRNQGGTAPGNWDIKDLTLSARYKRQDSVLGGRRSNTEVAWLYADILPNSTNRGYNATRTVQFWQAKFTGYDNTVLIKNDLEAIPDLWLTTGIASIWQTRGSAVTSNVTVVPVNAVQNEKYYTLAPRVGLRYDFTPHLQVYGNVSRSDEAPIAHQLPTTATVAVLPTIAALLGSKTASVETANNDVKNQTQNTVEFGGRGDAGIFKWNLAYYYARIHGEILTIQVSPAVGNTPAITATTNAKSDTVHQGFEGTLDAALWSRGGNSLVLHQSLTLNDFHFISDPVYGHNTLPAVPQRLYQAGLDYTHRSGFYAGVNGESVRSKYPADFFNSIYTPAYAVWGARVGWQSADKKWQVFVEGNNLGDKHYAAVVSPSFNAKGVDSAVYSPGQTRNVSIGISHDFF